MIKIRVSRILRIYWTAVIALGLSCFFTARAWRGNGKAEKRLQQKEEAGQKVLVRDYVAVYGPKALYINSSLCLLLLAAGPFATRRPAEKSSIPGECPPNTKKLGRVIVLLTMAGSAVWMAPRLHHGLWADEATTMRKFSVGGYERQEDGTMKYKPITAEYRQFSLKTPNNHLFFSTLSNLSHQFLFKQSSDPQATYFSEWILRLPAVIAGLGALLTVWWLAQEMGFGAAAWVPAVLLALHPWHLQYSSEARGYSMILALTPASFAAALRALRTGHVRWWLLYALMQVIMIDTWPLALDVLVCTNLVVLGMILTTCQNTRDRLTQLGRWGACCTLAAMAAIQLLLPALPQLRIYMKEEAVFKEVPFATIVDAYTAMLMGGRWSNPSPENPYVFTWANHSVGGWLLLGGLSMLLVAGAVHLWRTSRRNAWMVGVIVLVPAFILTHLRVNHSIFLLWYWVPAMPGMIILVAAGIRLVAGKIRAGEKWLTPVTLALFALGTVPQQLLLREAPLQRNREAAQLTRKTLNPTLPGYGNESITAYISLFYQGYDSDAVPVGTVEELEKLMRQSQQERRPLFVNVSRPNLPDQAGKAALATLEDPKRWKKHPSFFGTEWESTRWVYEFLK